MSINKEHDSVEMLMRRRMGGYIGCFSDPIIISALFSRQGRAMQADRVDIRGGSRAEMPMNGDIMGGMWLSWRMALYHLGIFSYILKE